MRNVSRLWRALESVPGLAAVPARWHQHCGSDYQILRPFLKPTDMIAAAYPCHGCPAAGCSRDIVDFGGGEILAVCRDPWYGQPDIPLTAADTILHQVDLGAFTQALARPLGIRWQTPIARGHGVWGVGLSANEYGIERAVVLVVHTERERFRSALSRLLADFCGKFVLLSPTDRNKDLEIHDLLVRRDIPMYTLEASLGINEQGRFIALQPGVFPLAALEPHLEATPVADRPERVDAFRAKYGLTVKEILTALDVDRRDFNRWRNGELPNSSSKSKKIEAYLRTGPIRPSKVR